MSLEEWEEYVAVKRVRAWGETEEEWVSSLPPDEQDVVYELAARLDIRPVEEAGPAGVGSPPRSNRLVTHAPPDQLTL